MVQGPLSGIRIIEMEGIGPGPFSGMHLADLGADVVLIERKEKGSNPGSTMPIGILKRGKRSIALDLKNSDDQELLMNLIEGADALIEGMRPGVMERLNLGPDACMKRNPRLVYGRITGWGQDGPLAQAAGHDLNYVAVSSAMWYASPAGGKPLPPPGLVGDVGGGANYLTIGLLAGIIRARTTGKGDVIDAAIVDGSAHMMNLVFDLLPKGLMQPERGQSALDGAPWYNSYRCADGRYITLGSLEPKFYSVLLDLLNLTDDPVYEHQFDKNAWANQAKRLSDLFASQPSAHWCELLEGSDACFGLVTSPTDAADHPHNKERGIFDDSLGFRQAIAAPRFASVSNDFLGEAPLHNEHRQELIDEMVSEQRRWIGAH
mgnify:FL=1|tara:strand:+ start:4561 stop:5688 length:1128 start_codon:yes stop_codon:yes gene_type:complete